MKRKVEQQLAAWKNNPNKMPLIIEGARQVGKTWIMKDFGSKYYKNTAYFNFDDSRQLHKLFETDLNPKRIVSELEFMSGHKIIPHETLVIFDEIQECNRALVSLKYFCENAPEYHVISAGSLLGVAIHGGNSFPVGKVDTIHLYPMTFAEFLDALGETRYHAIVEKRAYSSAYAIENDLINHLKYYCYVGGMPKAIQSFVSNKNLEEVRQIQKNILLDYERDFSKHIDAPSIPKIGMIWNSIPSQLAKENKQFVYKEMKQGARASQFESAFHWLTKVGLIYTVNRIETPRLPLSAYKQNAFKVYMLDVGLLATSCCMQGLPPAGNSFYDISCGLDAARVGKRSENSLVQLYTEQYVLQELQAAIGEKNNIFYWMNDRKKGLAEVDFLLQYEGNIIPIEAKASINLKAKSLKAYMDYYNPQFALRTSLAQFSRNKNLYDIPLYLIGEFPEILKR